MFLNHSSKPSYNEEKHIFACCEKECLQLTSAEIVFCAISALARIHKTVELFFFPFSFSCPSSVSFAFYKLEGKVSFQNHHIYLVYDFTMSEY